MCASAFVLKRTHTHTISLSSLFLSFISHSLISALCSLLSALISLLSLSLSLSLFISHSHSLSHLSLISLSLPLSSLCYLSAISFSQAGVLPPIAKLPAFVDRVETIARSVRAGRSAVVESTYHKLVGAAFRWLEAAAKVQSALLGVCDWD